MTSKEAIEVLKANYPDAHFELLREAVDVAIKVLKTDVPDINDGDMISRKAAIDALSHMMDTDGFRDGWAVSRANVDCMLRSLPSVQPDRKTGRWEMKHDHYGFFDEIPVCSECGCTTKMREVYKFCPNCGADMSGEDDE